MPEYAFQSCAATTQVEDQMSSGQSRLIQLPLLGVARSAYGVRITRRRVRFRPDADANAPASAHADGGATGHAYA